MPTPAGRALTEAHRLAQVRLGAQTVGRLSQVWPLLDIDNLDGPTLRAWLNAAEAVVKAQRQSSAGLAAQYLRAHRMIETGTLQGLRVAQFPAADEQALRTSLTVRGPVAVKAALTRGLGLEAAAETGLNGSARAGLRHVLNGGRDLIKDTISNDRRAKGYERVTSGSACSFCSMLAGRRFDGPDAFPAHDGCGCQAAPVY